MADRDGVELQRVRTGEPRLDALIDGGFPINTLNIIMGPPGTGKTILAEQVLFENARGERPVVYVSTLAEPMSKMVTFLQRFSFYDADLMMEQVFYEDVGAALLEGGAVTLVDRVREILLEREPAILIIDSFKVVHDLARDEREMRMVSARLARLLAGYSVTAFLVGEYARDAMTRYPEFAVADGVVQMIREPADNRDNRRIRILKLRGSDYRQGNHAFSISDAGIHLYPRLVSPGSSEDYEHWDERLSTGVSGLDGLLDGGLWRGTSTIVLGPSGAGKTSLGLSFALEGARSGQPTTYLNFQENPTQLRRAAGNLDPDLDVYQDDTIFFTYRSPVEMQIDSVVVALFEQIEREGIERVVIDALGDLALAAASRERFHDYLYATVQHFAARGVTSMLLLEGHEQLYQGNTRFEQRFSTLSDAIISLGYEDTDGRHPTRRLRVVKARNTAHSLASQVMEIDDTGIRLHGPESS